MQLNPLIIPIEFTIVYICVFGGGEVGTEPQSVMQP